MFQKKDGTWKLCINYRSLNKIIVKNRYTISRIDNLLGQLKGTTFFSNIDLKSGYHQVPIEQTNVQKIALKCKQVLFECLVIHFGLNNATTTFMIMMDDILLLFTNSFMVAYLDDILIFNESWEKHLKHIQQVMSTL